MGEEPPKEKSWKSVIKRTYQDAKQKIKEYAQEGSESTDGRSAAKNSKQYYGKLDEALNISCPTCNAQIPKELLKNIGQNTSVVCERCGSLIDRADFR